MQRNAKDTNKPPEDRGQGWNRACLTASTGISPVDTYFFLGWATRHARILVPCPGLEPMSPANGSTEFLTTGHQGRSNPADIFFS